MRYPPGVLRYTFMYSLYHTSGFVLSNNLSGEANRRFRIFTKDFGLLSVSAQGVRFLKSKLRYNLQDFSYCDLSLVRGREFWRVTGAAKRENLFEALHDTPEMFKVFARAFSLLERLLSGEGENAALFGYLEEAVKFALLKNMPAGLTRNFECILVLRILNSLGYLAVSPDTLPFAGSPYWSETLLARASSFLPKIMGEINRSLKETQL